MQPSQIIRTYLILTGLYTLAASLIWGINTLFLLDAGLTLGQVFLVNSIFTGAMALFEIPTGVLADLYGRRASFLTSIGILLLGTLGYVRVAQMPANFWPFAAMSVILGLGYTFYSGAMEAWLVDALKHSGYRDELDPVFARSAMVSGAGMLAGSLAGGALATFDLAYPFLVRAGLLAAVFAIALRLMHDLGFTARPGSPTDWPRQMGEIARMSVRYGWRIRPVRLLILVSLVQSFFMAWGFYAWQPYFLDLLGRDLPWVAGAISALISLATMAGNWLVDGYLQRIGRRTTLLLGAAVIQTAAIVGMGLAGSFWLAVSLYLVAMGMTGILGPVRQGYLHQLIPSEQRATVISFESLIGSGGSMVGQNGLAWVAGRQSLAAGYVAGGLFTLLGWPVILLLRRENHRADFIEDEAGPDCACAARGLPSICTVDTQAGAELQDRSPAAGAAA